MQKPEGRKRLSILKKRRSRSVSPTRSPTEKPTPRISRRISFSGKHAVREFFIGAENTETIWGASYEESTEHHAISNEQLTMHQSNIVTMQQHNQTKNETVHVDMSIDCSSNIMLPMIHLRSSSTNRTIHSNTSIEIERKDNVVYQRKSIVAETVNMDISKSAPAIRKPLIFQSLYKNQERKAEATVASNPINISVDNSMNVEPQKSIVSHSVRSTICEPRDISIDYGKTPTIFNQNANDDREQLKTINNDLDMSVQMPIFQKKPLFSKSIRKTLHESQDVSIDYSKPMTTREQNLSQGHAHDKTIPDAQDMSIQIPICQRKSVICKSPSKKSMQNVSNHTKYFNAEVMDVTEGAETMQPSYYPLHTTAFEETNMELSQIQPNNNFVQRSKFQPKATNKYMRMYLGQASLVDENEKSMEMSTIEPKTVSNIHGHSNPEINQSNHDILLRINDSIALDQSTGAVFVEYPKASRENFPPYGFNKTLNDSYPMESSINNTSHQPKADHKLSVTQKSMLSNLSLTNVNIDEKENIYPLPCQAPLQMGLSLMHSHDDKENDPALIEIMCENNTIDLSTYNVKIGEKMQNTEIKQPIDRSQIHIYNESIGSAIGMSSITSLANDTIAQPIEISDTSIQIIEPKQDLLQSPSNKRSKHRSTCYEVITLEECPPAKTCDGDVSVATKATKDSRIQRQTPIPAARASTTICVDSPITITDDSVFKKPSPLPNKTKVFEVDNTQMDETLFEIDKLPVDSVHHLTFEMAQLDSNNASVATGSPTLELSRKASNPNPIDFLNRSVSMQQAESELTFIDDTEMELHDSFERKPFNTVKQRSQIDQNHQLMIDNSFFALPSKTVRKKDFIENQVPPLMPTNILPDPYVDANAIDAFKKSNLLRRSNAVDIIDIRDSTKEQNENLAVGSVIADDANIKHKGYTASKADEMKTSSLMQRSSLGSEVSYLMNVTTDKPISELKIDFSGYDKFKGLATPRDVFQSFNRNVEHLVQLNRTLSQQIVTDADSDAVSINDGNDDEPLVSLNVEAPSFTFLWRNKIAMEDEELEAELEKELKQQEVGAIFPIIPVVDMLVRNKCNELKNWKFNDLWFFAGSINLRNKMMPAFKITITYDADLDAMEQSINMYGSLKFKNVSAKMCADYCGRLSAERRLCLQEIFAKLPINLLAMCSTSADLSKFDDSIHEFCLNATRKVFEVGKMCARTEALLRIENDSVYIIKTIFDCERYLTLDYIIDLVDIDNTGWRSLRTKPRRILHESVKDLPKGIQFIEEILMNDIKYLPLLDSN